MAASKQSFVLVIADIRLGEMSGIEMIQRIAENSPGSVVITISGNQAID